MTSTTLLIIRHAEKPEAPADGPGLSAAGEVDAHSLVIRGWQRAGAWAALFSAEGSAWPKPDVIYAADPNAGDGASQRPFETVSPLAARLGLRIDTTWALGQEAELGAAVRNSSGTALVCWEHRRIISDLLPVILGGQAPPGVPDRWHRERFDVVLRLDRASPDAPWRYRQGSPCLLAGDTAAPL